MGLEDAAPWLAVDGLRAQFAKRRSLAQQRYAQFVAEGIKAASPWSNLKGQVFLGDDEFVQSMQAHFQPCKGDVQIPPAQRRPPPLPLKEVERRAPDRNAAIVAAYATGIFLPTTRRLFRGAFHDSGKSCQGWRVMRNE